MKTDELESLLEGASESSSVEFKDDIPWHVNTFVKDILALSNIQDGGVIIIGVEDGTFARKGLSTANRATYVIETMLDQVSAYADPHADFSIDFPSDRNGVLYGVINVRPFEEVPVICRRDGHDVQAGIIYYRSKTKRPSSARVSNSYDMREIMENAAVRMMQRKIERGFIVGPRSVFKQKLDDEIKDL